MIIPATLLLPMLLLCCRTKAEGHPVTKPTAAAKPHPPTWTWLLILLSGNSSVASHRQRDLPTYLKLNLAARIDADYNDVVVNRVLLTHGGIVANVSVEPAHLTGAGAAGLQSLAKGNVTLLQLSGQEFLVKRILRASDIGGQRIVELDNETSDPEVAIYGAVGAFLLFVFFLVLLGLVFHGPCRRGDKPAYDEPFDQQEEDSVSTELRMICSMPPVIYTEQLAREMSDSVNLLHTCHSDASEAGDGKNSGSSAARTWAHPALCAGRKAAFLSLHQLKTDEDLQAILSPSSFSINFNSY